MLKKFDMDDCKPDLTPTYHRVVLCRYDGVEMANETTYRSIIRILMFLRNIGLDIAYSISLVFRYMKNPYEMHMKVTKRIREEF